MWLSCHTQEEIAEAVNIPQQTIADEIRVLPDLEAFPKSVKLHALFDEAEFEDEVSLPYTN